jgi:hypothetical protein
MATIPKFFLKPYNFVLFARIKQIKMWPFAEFPSEIPNLDFPGENRPEPGAD